ncbi:MAG TPA: outer membrane beta-barrel protein [Candidatus Polarisedimenticolaceae bacterium]|nr:outer membrane beta-barrel protein [Candidatus Polarisedimenticolaceae bacterium]
MRRRAAGVGILLAMAAVPASTAAPDPLQPPDLTRYLRWGPVRVRPSVHFSNIGYDTNVFYRTGNEPLVGDWTATVSPRADGLVLFGHRAFLTFREQIDGVLFAKYTEISYLDHRGTARFTVPFSHVGLFTEATINNVHERSTSELDARPQRNEHRLALGVLLPLGWRTRLELSQTGSNWTYRDDLTQCPTGGSCVPIDFLLDRKETGRDLKAAYLLRGRTTLTLDASTRDVEFEEQSARDSRQFRVLPGIELGQGGGLQGKLRAGQAHVDSIDTRLADFRGLVGNLEAAWLPAGRTRFTFKGDRDVSFAAWSGNQFYVNWQGELRGVHWMTRSFGLEGAALTGRLRFSDDNRVDSVNQYEAGIRFRLGENSLGRRIEYNLLARRFRRDSAPDDALDQSRSSIGFGAVLGY